MDALPAVTAAAAFALAVIALPHDLRAEDEKEWKDENVAIEEDAGGTGNGGALELLNGGDTARMLQLVEKIGKNIHSIGGSYNRINAPGWGNDRYEGSLKNIFRVGDSYLLGFNLSYGQYNSFKDDDYPRRLYNTSGGLFFAGDRIYAYVGAANRSDRHFSGFDDITLSGAVLGTVYRSGQHAVLFGGIFTLRGELWKFPAPLPVAAYRFVNRQIVLLAGLPMFLAWKPSKWFTMTLAGFLPGVGKAVFAFKISDLFGISLDYARKKESYYLNRFPYHDGSEYADHIMRDLAGKTDAKSRFILESNQTGVRVNVRPADKVSIFAYAGYRFGASYYLTKDILALHARQHRIANALSISAGVNFTFMSGEGALDRMREKGDGGSIMEKSPGEN